MLSESARATSAAESAFRVARPNSVPRGVAVVALDLPSKRIVDELAGLRWGKAWFHRASDPGGRTALDGDLATAKALVLVASAGQCPAADVVERCRASRVPTTALVIAEDPAIGEADAARTVAQLRRSADTVVVASSADYVGDLLAALRA